MNNTFPEEVSFLDALYNRCEFGSFMDTLHISNNAMVSLINKGYKIDKLSSSRYLFHKTQMFNKESHFVKVKQN